MLRQKTQVMNFITCALNSDSMAVLFKSSRQGTVWKLSCPVRNTGSQNTKKTNKVLVVGEEHETRCILVREEATSARVSALLRQLSDACPRLSTSALIHLPVTASLSPQHTRQDLHFHTQKPPGSRGRVRKLAKALSVALALGPTPTLKRPFP